MECKAATDWWIQVTSTLFNRYIVECKVICFFYILLSFMRFNRYIVECKVLYEKKSSNWKKDLIDTLWNVKTTPQQKVRWKAGDLIDTLWNVKTCGTAQGCEYPSDLIDTLWNVKFSHVLFRRLCLWFNRYIVDCKGKSDHIIGHSVRDLIDTLWNVKGIAGTESGVFDLI